MYCRAGRAPICVCAGVRAALSGSDLVYIKMSRFPVYDSISIPGSFFLYSFGLFSMCRIRIRGDEREPVAAALTAATRVYIDGLRTCRWSEPLGTQVPERESKSGKCTLCCLTPIYYYYTKTLFGVCQLRKAATSCLCCALLNYRPSIRVSRSSNLELPE